MDYSVHTNKQARAHQNKMIANRGLWLSWLGIILRSTCMKNLPDQMAMQWSNEWNEMFELLESAH